MSAVWNPAKYMAGAFGNSRNRAAFDLLAKTKDAACLSNLDVRNVLDLGCGPGNITANLKYAFPGASILGIDSSLSMIDTAKHTHANVDDISFGISSIEEVSLADKDIKFDVIYCNAALHWVLNHQQLLPNIMKNRLKKNGLFAFQMPDTRTQMSHLLMEEAAKRIGAHDEMFKNLNGICSKIRIPRVEEDPQYYAEIFHEMNSDTKFVTMDHWATEYVHHLPIDPLSTGTGTGVSGVSNDYEIESDTDTSKCFLWPAEHPVCGWTSSSGLLPIAEFLGKNAPVSDPIARKRYERYMQEYNKLLYRHYPPMSTHQMSSTNNSSYQSNLGSHYVMLGYKRYFCIVSQCEP